MKNYYELTKKLNIDNVGFDARAMPCHIMAMFQEAITLHTFEMGVDFASIRKKHKAKWFVISTRLEIEKRPAIDDTVLIKTWPLKSSALKFPRVTVMTDDKGNTLAKSMTDWCIADVDTDEILRANTLEFPFDEFLSENPMNKRCRIPLCETGELCYSKKILLSDLDLNRHVNNVQYIKFATDCFTMEEFDSMNFKSLDIQYKLQCFEGDTLDIYKTKTQNGYVIEGKRLEDTVFMANFEM